MTPNLVATIEAGFDRSYPEDLYVADARAALESLLEQNDAQRDALLKIAVLQDNALRYIETNGFVFDDIGKEPGNWKHLAFSLYTDLCEADTWAHAGLDLPLGETPASNPASSPPVNRDAGATQSSSDGGLE